MADDIWKFSALMERSRIARGMQFNRELDAGAMSIITKGGSERDVSDFINNKIQQQHGTGLQGFFSRLSGPVPRQSSQTESNMTNRLMPKQQRKPEQAAIWYTDKEGNTNQAYVPKDETNWYMSQFSDRGFKSGIGTVSPSAIRGEKADVTRQQKKTEFSANLKQAIEAINAKGQSVTVQQKNQIRQMLITDYPEFLPAINSAFRPPKEITDSDRLRDIQELINASSSPK